MRRGVLMAWLAVAAGPAWAQEADEVPANATIVDLRPQAAQFLAMAARASATADAVGAAEAYRAVAHEFEEAERSWVVPDPTAPETVYLGVHEALRRQLRAEPADVLDAWERSVDAQAGARFRSAGTDPPALAAIAVRFPCCPWAVAAMTRLGDLHLEAGRSGRALGCYRTAARHQRPDRATPPDLTARLALAARAGDPLARATPVGADTLAAPATTWLSYEGQTPTRRNTDVRGPLAAVAGRTWVAVAARDAEGHGVARWEWNDEPAIEQARRARDLDRNARKWAEGLGRRWRVIPSPPRATATPAPTPLLIGNVAVALLGESAPAARALAPVYHRLYARIRLGGGWWLRTRGERFGDTWDGAVPEPRSLVALGTTAAAREPVWRLGGADGIPGADPLSDFASAPVACGGDLCIATITMGNRNEVAVNVLRLDGATGAVRSAVWVACVNAVGDAVRGPGANMLPQPPGVAVGFLHGQIVAVTNLGIVAACDAETGAVRWLRRYPQRATDEDGACPADPVADGDALVVVPWDADQCWWLDPETGAARGHTDFGRGRPLQLLTGRTQGTLLALQGDPGDVADQLVALDPGEAVPMPVVDAPPGAGWLGGVIRGRQAWLVGRDAVDRVDLTTGRLTRVYWFGRDRPFEVACVAGTDALVVTTDRHLHWFRFDGR